MEKVYVKEDACISCRLCEVYCRLAHSQSRDLIKAFKKEVPPPLSRIRMEKNGIVSFSVRCQQCKDAPCVSACLTGALSREAGEDIVRLDEDKCMGCWTCMLVCPFGAIRQDIDYGKAVKCDLCQGEETPACVANCPNEALVYDEDLLTDKDIVTQVEVAARD
ncbi:4Fe-4S dicluster domain-containing protein [Chloroflexota bacterium]